MVPQGTCRKNTRVHKIKTNKSFEKSDVATDGMVGCLCVKVSFLASLQSTGTAGLRLMTEMFFQELLP